MIHPTHSYLVSLKEPFSSKPCLSTHIYSASEGRTSVESFIWGCKVVSFAVILETGRGEVCVIKVDRVEGPANIHRKWLLIWRTFEVFVDDYLLVLHIIVRILVLEDVIRE
jgi:hypothetical protein